MTRIIALLLAAAVALGSPAQKQLKRHGIKPVRATAPAAVPAPDTIVPAPGAIVVAGFDKPLRSNREAMFVTNNTATAIEALRVDIDYTSPADGRQLHRRQALIRLHIPAGETRRVEIPAWDRTGQFHYRLTPPPRGVAQATPFDVAVAVLSATPAQKSNPNQQPDK